MCIIKHIFTSKQQTDNTSIVGAGFAERDSQFRVSLCDLLLANLSYHDFVISTKLIYTTLIVILMCVLILATTFL